MKLTVLDVLIYLFERYLDEDQAFILDRDQLKGELDYAGFSDHQVEKAFAWLEILAEQRADADELLGARDNAFRIYTSQEMEKLDRECRGFLLFLEQARIMDASAREMIIDRVMALDSDEIDLEQLKWVVVMVLFNQSSESVPLDLVKDLIMDEIHGMLH